MLVSTFHRRTTCQGGRSRVKCFQIEFDPPPPREYLETPDENVLTNNATKLFAFVNQGHQYKFTCC